MLFFRSASHNRLFLSCLKQFTNMVSPKSAGLNECTNPCLVIYPGLPVKVPNQILPYLSSSISNTSLSDNPSATPYVKKCRPSNRVIPVFPDIHRKPRESLNTLYKTDEGRSSAVVNRL